MVFFLPILLLFIFFFSLWKTQREDEPQNELVSLGLHRRLVRAHADSGTTPSRPQSRPAMGVGASVFSREDLEVYEACTCLSSAEILELHENVRAGSQTPSKASLPWRA